MTVVIFRPTTVAPRAGVVEWQDARFIPRMKRSHFGMRALSRPLA
jgi:hypothetical protein